MDELENTPQEQEQQEEEELQRQMGEVQTFHRGDIVEGTVTKIENGVVYVDIGYRVDAVIPQRELSNTGLVQPEDVVSVGQKIEVKVLSVNEEEDKITVSKRAVDAVRAWDRLQKIYENNETFEAKVVDVVKGGLVVDVGVRGFIPASQVETHFVEDFADYKGKTLRLKVIELDKSANKVILSHRAVLEEEREAQREELMTKLQPGQILTGTVERITDFGAFVDVGGVDGLVHISELAWHRVGHPSEVIHEGDQVQVKVLRVDEERGRISLSIKQTQPGPWENVEERFHPGDIVTGTVKRLVGFGAFVEIAPGLEGLVHISQIANRRISSPSEVLEVGDQVRVKILDIDPEAQRISLSIREAEEDRGHRDFGRYDDNKNNGSSFTIGDVFGDLFKKNR